MVVNASQLERMGANLAVLEVRTHRLHRALAAFRTLRPQADERCLQLALTARECVILRLIAAGHDNGEIALELHFALGTIKMHVRDILAKLDATSRTEAAVRAVRLRVI